MAFGFGFALTAIAKAVGFSPSSLFASGAQGAWYDPSDFLPNWRRNLLTYTEQFDNAAWGKSDVFVTADAAIAPNGTLTAEKLIPRATTSPHSVYLTGTFSAQSTLSIHYKAAEYNYGFLVFFDGSFRTAVFDLVNGVVTQQPSVGSASILPSTNGYLRCSITFGMTPATYIYFGACPTSTLSYGNPMFSGNDISGIYIWGAQLETGSTATAYQKITDGVQDYLTYQPQPIMYQDVAGTTPVTAVEQPVGLMLDKSRGLVLGSELVTNGTFDTNVSGWSVLGGSFTWNNGTADLSISGAGTAYVRSTFATVAGVRYFGSYTINSNNSGAAIGCYVGSVAGDNSLVSVNILSGKRTFSFIASGTTTHIQIWYSNPGGNSTANLDNISVKELPGNHAYQSTTTSRPTLSARYNLLTKTEQFDDAVWNAGSLRTLQVSANATTAPDGTVTADKVVEAAAGAGSVIQRVVATDATATSTKSFSIAAKKAERKRLYLFVNGPDQGAWFDLDLGTCGPATDYPGASASITQDANGFYRCKITPTSGSGGYIVQAAVIRDSATTFDIRVGDGTSGIYVWGADLRVANDGVNLPAYQRVDTATDYDYAGFPPYLKFDGTDDGMATNSIGFATATSDGLARRNLLTYPTAFDDAAWTKNASTVSANATTAPDGTTTADKIVSTAATTNIGVTQGITAAASSYTQSWYVKASGCRYVQLLWSGGSSADYANFDLQAGTVTASSGGTATIAVESNGFYRIALTSTLSAGACGAFCWMSSSGSAGRGATFAGDGTSGIYIWGAQLETGSTATAFQNIGTDKMSVFAGVRKLSDAIGFGVPAEFGNRTSGAAGSWTIHAPATQNAGSYMFASQGTIASNAEKNSGYASPITNIVTGIGDISGASVVLRLNASQAASNAASQGTGNFGAYPLYIGRRAGSSLPFNGRFYGLVVVGKLASAAEITATEAYINNRTRAY